MQMAQCTASGFFGFPSNAVFFDLSHYALTIPLSVWFYGFPAVKSKITPFKQHPAMKTYPFNDKSPPNLLLKNGNIRPAVLFQCRLAPPSGGSDTVLMFCVFFFSFFLFFSFLFLFFYFIIIFLVCGWLLVEMQKLATVNSASRLRFTLVICWLKFSSL